MTAIFWGNETCQSAPHVQHFAKNITHTLECQCKKTILKRVKKTSSFNHADHRFTI